MTKNLNFNMGIGNDFIDIASESTTQTTILTGGEGDDVIVGGAGADTIYGNAGEDLIMGMGGDDTIHGGDNDDTLEGGEGADTIYGGNETPVEINGRLQGGDTILGGAGNDKLYGQGGIDTIEGVRITTSLKVAMTVTASAVMLATMISSDREVMMTSSVDSVLTRLMVAAVQM